MASQLNAYLSRKVYLFLNNSSNPSTDNFTKVLKIKEVLDKIHSIYFDIAP